MHTELIIKSLSDGWPGLLLIFAILWVAYFLPPHADKPAQVRQLLGGLLDRFGEVPAERLDARLGAAARASRGGWRGVGMALGHASQMMMIIIVIQALFLAMSPPPPLWVVLLLLVLTIVLSLYTNRLLARAQRRAILRRLELLLGE